MYKKSVGEIIFEIINIAALGLLAFITVYPFLYTLSISLSTAAEAVRDGLHLFPQKVSFLSYRVVFLNPDILTGFGNSAFRTILGTTLTLLMTSIAAYPLSRKYMPNRKLFTFLILFTMLFSGGVIPSYLLIKSLHLIDNRLVLIIPGMIGAFNVIILKSFFQSLPDSLAESAKIDGAGEAKILFRIMLPLSTPALATIGLWMAVWHWNAWFDALLYINTNSKQVLQVFLQRIVIQNSQEMIAKGLVNPDITQFTPETVKSAVIIATILPILVVYPFLQKYFVKGVMLGAIKE